MGSEIDLGYKFREGEVNTYKLHSSVEQIITVPGESPIRSNQEVEMYFSETVTNVNYDELISDTVATIKTDFDRLILKTTSGEHRFSYDSSKGEVLDDSEALKPIIETITNSQVLRKMSTKGRILNIDFIGPLKEAGVADLFSSISDGVHNSTVVEFPPEKVEIGDAWIVEAKLPLSTGSSDPSQLQMDITYSLEGFEEIEGYSCARIGMDCKIKPSEIYVTKENTGVKNTMVGVMKGDMYVALDRGILVKKVEDIELSVISEVSLELPEQSYKQITTTHIQATEELSLQRN